ncbi:tRNA (N6-threonylcarbamoyladenosine(37)-N6)-methyltransferase TrmO [Marinobacterium arenosum]|uniref:tRNA (N6-threonylcarbamoyladenosine(37)-N6)-methyltransferase TrmO n=1 Tax=Marinobacterium arenosum TaxID=2862496 RepID=UPI001C982632|nr:tRNA (N6-threonylcarbamoyladenosine(37)-N6)-methyltransferase TrmO [Marinobacterium arenosum]MBY4678537.1 tRNA (N6-threonylcarbamoyladenosine(37)-N6)-methyltransferase TrmO [Marinobacterium arenosum]
MSETIQFQPIGHVRCGFKQKFGIPRQPGLVNSMQAIIELAPDYASREAVRGLEQCSHIWLLFLFSECVGKGWAPLVRPPRLGGNQRLGVFASRSPFRPNPVGLSPVRLDRVECRGEQVLLHVTGADLLDGTPIIDIKPYLPYSDRIDEAEFGLAQSIEQLELPVEFSEQAAESCQRYGRDLDQPLARQISEILRCDPRPAYKKGDSERVYGLQLHHLNIRWQITDQVIHVLEIEPV